jgi:hypothetical protein
MYVNVQSVLPNMFVYGDVPWVSFGFSFFCVNQIICCKVSNSYKLLYKLLDCYALCRCLRNCIKWPKGGVAVGWKKCTQAHCHILVH